MTFSFITLPAAGTLAVWSILAFAGACGAVALASPRLFAHLAKGGNRWIDTSQALAALDKPIDLDAKVLPHARILGGAVLAAVAFLAFAISG